METRGEIREDLVSNVVHELTEGTDELDVRTETGGEIREDLVSNVGTDELFGRMEARGEIREDLVSNVGTDELFGRMEARGEIREELYLDLRNFYGKPSPTIHRIPSYIRKGNESAYTPRFVSIGPYHRDVHKDSYLHEQTKGMKILYLQNFLHRTRKDVKHYVSLIKSSEEDARDCYYDRCNRLKTEEFVQMMVLDGCFIMEFLLKFKYNNGDNMQKWWWRHLRNDLMLMENQIPFFILKLILDNSDLVFPEVVGSLIVDYWRPEILDLCLFFLYEGKIIEREFERILLEDDIENVYHLLHLSYLRHMIEIIPQMEFPPETLQARLIEKSESVVDLIAYGFLFLIKFFLLSFFSPFIFLLYIMWHKRDKHIRQKVRAEEKTKRIPTATELNESGVTFTRKKVGKITDVTFNIDSGIMEIPVVRIDDSSSSKFRNYLALEQKCPDVGNKFTGYALFMDDLIDTASDVALLKKRNIIVSRPGCDEEVAKLFNGLTDGLVFDYRGYLSDNIHLEKLFDDADSYSTRNRNRWRVIINKLRRKIDKWMAMLMRDYFSSPWKIISLLGAVTLLACSVTQVVYAIKRK